MSLIAAEQVDISNDGAEAILDLAGGDLRRVLNLLQSSSMAYKKVDEDAVYLTAGAALRSFSSPGVSPACHAE